MWYSIKHRFVVFNNLSLQYNSVGFYQLMKVLITPVVIILQKCMYGMDLPFTLQLSLAPICLGVGMATVNDLSCNLVRIAMLCKLFIYHGLSSTKSKFVETGGNTVGHFRSTGDCFLSTLDQGTTR